MKKPSISIDFENLRCYRKSCSRRITVKNTKHGKTFQIIGVNQGDPFILCDECEEGLVKYLEKR